MLWCNFRWEQLGTTKTKVGVGCYERKQEKEKKREEAYFIGEESSVVERLDPHTLSEVPLLLRGDAFIHPLHGEANVVRKVFKGLLDVEDLPPSLGHRIEACIPFTMSFSPHVCHYTPFLYFDGIITTFVRLRSFLLLIHCKLLPFILLRWRRRARRGE